MAEIGGKMERTGKNGVLKRKKAGQHLPNGKAAKANSLEAGAERHQARAGAPQVQTKQDIASPGGDYQAKLRRSYLQRKEEAPSHPNGSNNPLKSPTLPLSGGLTGLRTSIQRKTTIEGENSAAEQQADRVANQVVQRKAAQPCTDCPEALQRKPEQFSLDLQLKSADLKPSEKHTPKTPGIQAKANSPEAQPKMKSPEKRGMRSLITSQDNLQRSSEDSPAESPSIQLKAESSAIQRKAAPCIDCEEKVMRKAEDFVPDVQLKSDLLQRKTNSGEGPAKGNDAGGEQNAPKGKSKPSIQAKEAGNTKKSSAKKGAAKPKLKPIAKAPKSVQTKLEVGAPDDKFEREADAVADKVMRMKDPVATGGDGIAGGEGNAGSGSGGSGIGNNGSGNGNNGKPNIQAMFESRIQRLGGGGLEDEEDGLLMRKAEGGAMETTPKFNRMLSGTKGGGTPLEGGTKSFMEGRMGHDFSNVRVHTGYTADKLSRGINARAFTHGNDVYFKQGQWSPGTDGGKRLLAHELTHTVQQGGSGVKAKVYRSEEGGRDGKELRNSIKWNRSLTQEQKSFFQWDEVLNEFSDLPGHAGVHPIYIQQWARVQLKQGWTLGDEVPDLTSFQAHYGEKKIYQTTGEKVKTLYVYRFDGNKSEVRRRLLDEYNYQGFWVYVNKITGSVSGLQQRNSVSRFYQGDNLPTQSELTDLFLFLEANGISATVTQADIEKIGVDSKSFRETVEMAQDLVFPDEQYQHYGLLTDETKNRIDSELEENWPDLEATFAKKLLDQKTNEGYETLEELSRIDRELLDLMQKDFSGNVYSKWKIYKAFSGAGADDREEEKEDAKDEYEKAANKHFHTTDNFQSKVTLTKAIFERRANKIAHNVLNNTENMLSLELESYKQDPEMLIHLGVLLKETKTYHREYLMERWYADRDDQVIETIDSYPFKGMGNPHGNKYVSALNQSQQCAEELANSGHPVMDYFGQEGREDQLGELLGLGYYQHPMTPRINLNQDSNLLPNEDLLPENPYLPNLYIPNVQTTGNEAESDPVNDPESMLRNIEGVINSIISNIKITRDKLIESPELVWELDNVVSWANSDLKLLTGSAADRIIRDELAAVAGAKIIRDLFLAALNIGLGILAMSGVGAPIAILAGVAATAVSVGTYIIHKEEYDFQKAASGTGTSSKTSLLSFEPSSFWLYLDLIGIGIDALIALKITHNVAKSLLALRNAKKGEEIAAKSRLLSEIRGEARAMLPADEASRVINTVSDQLDEVDDLRHLSNDGRGKIKNEKTSSNNSRMEADDDFHTIRHCESGKLGNVVEEIPLSGGHRISRMDDGTWWLCSKCRDITELMNRYGYFISKDSRLQAEVTKLAKMEKLSDPDFLTELGKFEDNLHKIINASYMGSRAKRTLKTINSVIENARKGILKEAPKYHGHIPRPIELRILSNPDRIYGSTSQSQRLIFLGGEDIVVVESYGALRRQTFTSYGPSGPKNNSGARALGGKPTDPGEPITHKMIVEGKIPDTGGGYLSPAVEIFP